MPNIKRKREKFLSTKPGENLTVAAAGAILFTLTVVVSSWTVEYVSTTLYPFSYPFLHTPIHAFLPQIAQRPPIPATVLFAAVYTLGIYHFEKNVFYRRFHLALKAMFAAVAACTFVFISSLLSMLMEGTAISALSSLLYRADVSELPALFVYYYLTSLPVFFICRQIRRRIFALP